MSLLSRLRDSAHRNIQRRVVPLSLTLILVCSIGSPVISQNAPSQNATPAPAAAQSGKHLEFEVASIKPINGPAASELKIYPGARIVLPGFTLKGMICMAFNVSYWQVSGGEDWIDKTLFEVEAEPPSDMAAHISLRHSWFNVDDPNLRLMMQSLLIERFQLKFHMKTKTGTVYLLEKSGKASPLQPAKTDKLFQEYGEGYSETSPQGGEWYLVNGSLSQVAKFLSNYILHAPVLDKTGLTGAFDFRPKAQPDFTQDPGGSALSGLSEMGLKLKKTTGPVEHFVIDQAEQPTPN